ncbi:MAG: FAD-dependent oxidoreductase [Anaerolineaceae bacterium]|nr:FAD-dependent oxidoreductase [Anaerolineaceae bacterium]
MEDDIFPVVVIGAGLAGLAAAAHLAAGGIPPLLLEADSRWPGGRMAGGDADIFIHNGREWAFTSEHGMHALWGGYDNMRATLERFTAVHLQESPGEEWINRWGREVRMIEAGRAVRWGWFPAPFHYLTLLLNPRFWRTITPLDFLSLPGFLFSILWTVGLDPLEEQVALDGLMMNEYFRGWTPNLRATFTGLGVNLLAAPAEEISLTSFIAAIRFFTMLRRDLWQPAYFPDSPHHVVIEPILEYIEEQEGGVMLGTEVQELQREGDHWRVIVEDSRRGGRRSLLAERVVLALDPPGAERVLLSGAATQEAAANLRFPGAVQNLTVRLWFDAPPRDGTPGGMFTGDFLPDNFFWLHRLIPAFKEWHTVTGGSVLEMHLYVGQDILTLADSVVLVRCVDEAQRAFPELRGHFVHGAVRRNLRTQTNFRIPTGESLQVATPWPGVYACGDWIGYPTPSMWMERCCVTGIAAANAVLHDNGRETFPIIPPREPEALVRALAGLVRLFRRTVGRAILVVARGLRRKRG